MAAEERKKRVGVISTWIAELPKLIPILFIENVISFFFFFLTHGSRSTAINEILPSGLAQLPPLQWLASTTLYLIDFRQQYDI